MEVLLEEGFVPVVASLAIGPDGHAYNVNADTAAAALAVAVRADKLVLLTDVAGIYREIDGGRELLSELSPDEARLLVRVASSPRQIRNSPRPRRRGRGRALRAHRRRCHAALRPPGALHPVRDRNHDPPGRPRAARARLAGMSTQTKPGAMDAIVQEADRVLFRNYKRAPVAFSHGRGVRLYDLEGREYLDFIGGIAVSSLGHAHPGLVAALSEQAARYIHVSNLYQIPEQVAAARRLVALSGLDRAFFCNSGAEANEAAIKLVRKRAKAVKGPECHEILVTGNSFHGRTLGTLAATGNPRYRIGFEPLPAGSASSPSTASTR